MRYFGYNLRILVGIGLLLCTTEGHTKSQRSLELEIIQILGVGVRIGGTTQMLLPRTMKGKTPHVFLVQLMGATGDLVSIEYGVDGQELKAIEQSGTLVLHINNVPYLDMTAVNMRILKGFPKLHLNNRGISKGDAFRLLRMSATYTFGIWRISGS